MKTTIPARVALPKTRPVLPAVSQESEGDYSRIVGLLARLTEATNNMIALEACVQAAYLDIVDEHRAFYTELQETISEAEEQVKTMAGLHPEWFLAAKTIKTPYGTVAIRATTKLEVANEELSIALIERQLDSDLYLRSRKFLNIEALESLDDASLQALQIARVTTEKCTVTPAKANLGAAVKKKTQGDKAVEGGEA